MRQTLNVLATLAFAIVLAACAQPIDSPTLPSAHTVRERANRRQMTATYRVIYRFGESMHDGAYPYASVIVVNGNLYGTTQFGGVAKCNTGKHVAECGTVFELTNAGAETVLHRFGSGSDGVWPQGTLVNVNGTLYGVTPNGGAYGQGAVFGVNPTTGTERLVYSFTGGRDGGNPYGGVIDVEGTLYGTTSLGGAHRGSGGVFSLNPTTGAERVLYSFKGGSDGDAPIASLTEVNGTLFGTTNAGGSGCGSIGCGIVFAVNEKTGRERILHRFGKGADGSAPYAGLTYLNGTLYGTTSAGGSSKCSGGCGTVFSVERKTGAEHVIHEFADGVDGADPIASLTDVNGTLYGTTTRGGATASGWGTIFSITTSGAHKVLHSFANSPDGAGPWAELTYLNGTLYGTTESGGANTLKGTVFSFSP